MPLFTNAACAATKYLWRVLEATNLILTRREMRDARPIVSSSIWQENMAGLIAILAVILTSWFPTSGDETHGAWGTAETTTDGCPETCSVPSCCSTTKTEALVQTRRHIALPQEMRLLYTANWTWNSPGVLPRSIASEILQDHGAQHSTDRQATNWDL